MTKRRLRKAFNKFDNVKKRKDVEIPGILGFTIGGRHITEVANRRGFVYVRLRNNANEVIQAYNDQVSPVYGLPVILIRDETDRTRYKVKGKDLGVYQDWNNTPYLPRHGNQHSFNPSGGGGGDVTFIYNRQFVPLSVQPSGSSGGGNVMIQPYVYYQGTQWKYAGGTGTSSFLPYKPTGTSARMVLVYLDNNGNPQLLPSDTYFSSSITGSAAVLPYIPSLGATTDVPLAAIRLVSGTSVISWDNIYDLRPLIVSDGFIPTGSSGHIIQDDGTPLVQQPALNFVGSNFSVYNTAGVTNVSGSFVGGGLGGGSNSIAILENSVFKVSGTAISFDSGLSVSVVGNTAHVTATAGTGSSGGYTQGARVYYSANQFLTGTVTTILPWDSERWDTDNCHSGTSTQLYCNTAGKYLIMANIATSPGAGDRWLSLLLNKTTIIGSTRLVNAGTGIDLNAIVSTIWDMNVGDYVEVQARASVGVNSLTGTAYAPEFMMQRIG